MSVEAYLELSEAQGGTGDGTHSVHIGPFEYVQVTYEGIAFWNQGNGSEPTEFFCDGGMWYPAKREDVAGSLWKSVGPDTDHHGYTDITISAVTA